MKRTPAVHLRNYAVVWIVSCLLTLVVMHSYILPLNSVAPVGEMIANDQSHMIWTLWFANESISSGHNPFVTQSIYWPVGANLSHHTLVSGYFPVTLATKVISRGDPLYPIYAYHLIIWLGFTMLLFFSFLWLRALSFYPGGSRSSDRVCLR